MCVRRTFVNKKLFTMLDLEKIDQSKEERNRSVD